MYKKVKSYFISGCLATLDSIHDKSRLTLLFNLAFAISLMGIVSAIISTVIGTYTVYVPAFGNIIFGLTTLYTLRYSPNEEV